MKPRRLGLLLAGLATGGCASAPRAERWMGAFPVYPGARPLCTQHLVGPRDELDWLSFASADEPARVRAFYAPGRDAGASPLEVRTPAGDKVLAVYPRDGRFPRCESEPQGGERTVIVVSRVGERGR